MVAHPGQTCRPSERLLARPDPSLLRTREPLDIRIEHFVVDLGWVKKAFPRNTPIRPTQPLPPSFASIL